MKTNSKEFRAIMDNYLFDALNNVNEPLSDHTGVAQYSKNYFDSIDSKDKSYMAKNNIQVRLAHFLSGLPFDIDFYNSDILKLAYAWGQINTSSSAREIEKREEKILNNWWNFIAYQVLKYWERHLK